MSGTIDWQHPFVDVFKQFNVFEQASSQSKGQVSVVQDNEIGRKVIRLTGAISANNSVTIPESSNKSLGLTGRYVYVEFYVTNGKYFTLHLDFIVKGREVPIRFTISNLYENYKVQQNSLQIPYPRDSKEKWTVLILDIQYFLSNFGLLPLSKYIHNFKQTRYQSFEGIHTLKLFQLCSSMSIKGIYTSDNLYDWDTMPKQMLFKLPKGAQWSNVYQIAFWNTKTVQPQIDKQPLQDVTSQIIENLQKIHPPSDKLPLPTKIAQLPKAAQQDELVKKRPGDQTMYTKSIDAPDHPLQPYPIMELKKVIGFTVRSCPDIKWGRSTDSQSQVVYAAGNLVVLNDLNTGNQRFLNGHSQSVSCLDVSRDGSWIVSGQSGRNSVLRVWDYKNGECLSAFATPYQELVCVALSSDSKLLVTSGLDDRNRETIIVWGLQNILTSRKPTLVAKQTSTSNVLAIRFSPIDNNRLISCGHENVRFWRIKNGHLPGSSVVLEHRARSTTFAVLDFEYSYKEHLGGLKHVFFGSKSGLLLQVGYNSMELEAVYKVHDQPVSALCVSAGFCVTGSKDQFLRVWPLDFSEFYIEARHEGIITSLDVSLDGLQVVCGTSTGGLGVLDISTHSYRTIVRSHTAKILQLQLHQYSGLLVSLSEDCTIRLWELEKNEQVYEFTFPSEDKCTVLSTHPKSMNFAAGFKSGVIRIFDIENTSIQEEARYHDAEIQHLTYNPNGTFLVVCDAKSIYRIYDTQRGYSPIKTLEIPLQSQNNCSAFSQDSEVLATIGDTGTQINLWDGASWANLLKITTTGTHFKYLEFAQNNIELVCGCTEGKIRIYGVERSQGGIHAYFLREQTFMHRSTLNNFYISPNYRYIFSVGGDAFLKVWDYEFSLKGPGSSQVMLGHTTSISSVCQVGSNIVSAGGEEGIFIWNFKGNSSTYQRELDLGNYQMIQSSTFGKGQQGFKQTNSFKQTAELGHEQLQEEQKQEQLDEIDDEQYNQQQDYEQNIQQQEEEEEIPQQAPPQQFQSLARENIQQQTGLIYQPKQQSIKPMFKPYRLEQQFEKQTIEYIRQNIKRKSSLKKFYEQVVPSDILYKQFDSKNEVLLTNAPPVISILASQDCHDNLVWCQAEGWVAWTMKNFIIFENVVQKERSQQVLELPFIVGVLALDLTQQFLLVGCAAKLNQDEAAPILVIDSKTKEIKNRLNFHTRGVQQIKFSEDGKYLVSIGNAKECTVVVWEWPNGKFISSSYTLDKLNEVQISKYSFSSDRLFEFCTVGRDQVHFWALSTDNILEYYDVFLPKNTETKKLDEITSFDYAYFSRTAKQLPLRQSISQGIIEFKEGTIQKSQTKKIQSPQLKLDDVLECVVFGLKSGEVAVLTYGDFQFVHRNKVCSGEIIGIIINQVAEQMLILSTDNLLISIDLLGVTSLNGLIELLNYNSHSIQKIRLPGSPSSFSFEPMTQQGVISFRSGQFSFISIRDTLITDLAATVKEVNQAFVAGSDIFVTIENEKIVRLWDCKNGSLLTEVNTEKHITSCFWDSHTRNIVIFNQGEVRIISVDRLDVCEIYNYRGKTYEDILILQGQAGSINSLPFKIVLGSNDSFYLCEQVYKNLEYSVRLKKILEFSNVDSIVLVAEKRLLFLIEKDNGIVNTLVIDYNNEREQVWGFTVLDIFNFKENPHGDLDQDIEQIERTKSLYKDVPMKTYLQFGSGFEGVYFTILSGLQYVYARNYQKQQIIFQVGLSDFPQSFTFTKISEHPKLLVGMKNSYEEINPQDQQDKNKRITHVQKNMKNILSFQDRIVCITDEGAVLYQV